MPYLYRAREYSINNVAGKIDQQWLQSERGIFGDDDGQLGFEKEEFDPKTANAKPNRINKKMHSLFFPFVWQECKVNSANIMLLSGEVKSMKEAQYVSNALMPNVGEED